MKNVIFAAIALTVLAVFGSSCTKEQVKPSEPGKAMITYTVLINSDETNDTTMNGNPMTMYEAVANQEIIFSMDSRDIQRNPVSGYNYETLTFRGTTDANGMVTIEVPAIGDNGTVEVRFPEMKIDVKRERLDRNGDPIIVMEEEYFGGADRSVSIFDGAQIIREYTY